MKLSLPSLLAVFLFASSDVHGAVAVNVLVDDPQWTISKYLVGMHMVYSNNPDRAYADGKVAEWARQVGIATARYPGGSVVKYWDWRDPTGIMTADRWNPAWKPSEIAPPQNWMSLDKYLDFVDKSGITPLLGVNSLSGYEHGKVSESIQRAADMVDYVKKKGHGGAFWYIGNEEEGRYDGRVAGYGRIFRSHAEAMKKVDPTIRIFWNCNDPTPARFRAFLENDGGTSDGLETHGKWPFGGDPANIKAATFDEWLAESPLRDRKNHREWRSAADDYRRLAASLGRPHYLIANNEYGIGKNDNVIGFDRYTYGLLMTEFLQEHFIGNWDMTCFWDNIRGDEDGLMSPPNNYRMNPFHFGMGLLAEAQGGRMIKVQTDNDRVHGFASLRDDALLLYLINKTKDEQPIAMTLRFPAAAASGMVMKDTADHWGELIPFVVEMGDHPSATLPALSFCRMEFTRGKR